MRVLLKDKKRAGTLLLLLLANIIFMWFILSPAFQDETIEIPRDSLLMDRGNGVYEEAFYVDMGYEGEHRIVTPLTRLRRGYYAVTVNYETNNGLVKKGSEGYGCWMVVAADTQGEPGYNAAMVESDRIEIFNGESPKTFTIRVKQGGDYRAMVCIQDVAEGLYALVGDVRIEYLQKRTVSFSLVYYGLPLLLLDILIVFYIAQKESTVSFMKKHAVGITAISFITFMAYYPNLDWNLFFEGDFWYHMNRIRFLADGIASGVFPVRVHPGWSADFGYAVGVYYGDLFLLPSALLLLCGVSLNGAYKFHVLQMSVITAASAYYAGKKISNDKMTGVVCSAVYTLSLHRIMLITPFNMVGQYGTHSVVPLVAVGLYGIYAKKKDAPYVLLLTLGLTGVMTHAVTSLMLLFVLPVLAVLIWRRTIQKEVWMPLLKSAGLTMALNLFYLVPFLDYMFNQKIIGSIVSGYPWHYAKNTMDVLVRNGNHPLDGTTIGLVPFLIVTGALGLLLSGRLQTARWEFLSVIGCSIFFTYFGTSRFPWYWLHQTQPLLERILMEIQFPMRFFVMVAGLLVVILAWGFRVLIERGQKSLMIAAGAILVGLTLSQMMDYYKDINTYGHRLETYDDRAKMAVLQGAEFVIPETLENGAIVHQLPTTDAAEVSLSNFGRNGTTVWVNAVNHSSEEQKISFPLWAYRYYVARSGRQVLALEEAEDHRVRVTVPTGFSGEVRVFYQEPWFWRLSELITVITILLILSYRFFPVQTRACYEQACKKIMSKTHKGV